MVDIQAISVIIAALSVALAALNSILTSRRTARNEELTLETRQAQMFMQMQNRLSDSMRDTPGFEVILNTKFDTFDEFHDLCNSDPTINKVVRGYAGFYESLGVLVKEKLIDVRLVSLMWGGTTRMFWEFLEPIIGEWRVALNYPRLWSETEYVCKEVLKYMDEHPELKT
jgi:hypothetical protein